ncbi:hypothetical protein SAMN04487868_106139 [Marinobacter salarius]|uniref:Pentapeptide repeat-containing protein n=1 Tax=Marinobacter salarius TaxID=1420917 RepID=A0ABY1FNF9_9GAMM|nr:MULTISPECIES: hypothetical protein [Marinobacter]KXJ44674.1 MAG: hypothetical protein AXW11_14705 [Marinobacter sp. Hex_13]SFL67077.1 hypothetical protein SAMN04487868_106139 [Marinobacter salarius]
MSILEGAQLQKLLKELLAAKDSTEATRLIGRFKTHGEIHFESVEWIALRETTKDGNLVFPKINWGGRSLVYTNCDFGDGDFIFPGIFHGPVVFHDPQFGAGLVSFAGSEFRGLQINNGCFSKMGHLNFDGCSFSGKTRLSIKQLGNKDLIFGHSRGMTEGEGESTKIGGDLFMLSVEASEGQFVDFDNAQFLAKIVAMDFEGATSLRKVEFNNTLWHGQQVQIRNLNLGSEEKPRLAFTNADFTAVRHLSINNIGMRQGTIIFALARFPSEAISHLHFGRIGPGKVIFHHAVFPGSAEFSQDEDSPFLSELSFKGSTFEGPLSLADMKFGPVPDLAGTQFSKHLNLANIEFGKGLSRGDIRQEKNRGFKLQRIKELAEGNRDHGLALRCHAEEMKWSRFRGGKGSWPAGVLDVMFEVSSNYGQSIWRPFFWLIFSCVFFAFIYRNWISETEVELLFSFAWVLPFLPATGFLRDSYGTVLDDGGGALYLLTSLHGLISFILLFLIGLGFRNRFRI